MNLIELYENNIDFRVYVERYRKKHGLTVDEALKHRIVRNYASYLAEENRI